MNKIGKVGKPDQRPPYPGARSTPTVDGNRLYVLGSDGDLACLEADHPAHLAQKRPEGKECRPLHHPHVATPGRTRRREGLASRQFSHAPWVGASPWPVREGHTGNGT